jgi:hypothetical protein
MWHRVAVVLTDVSEERIASILRVEGKIRKSVRKASVRDVKSCLLLIVHGTHWIGGWMGPIGGLDDVANSDSSVVLPVASRYTDWAVNVV